MTIYGAPPGRCCCCQCGADVTDDGPAGMVTDACGWPMHYCGACWTRMENDMNDIRALRRFAQRMLEDWPEATPDTAGVQDAAVECGLLALEDPPPTEPCGEWCHCAEYYGADEWAAGVRCYRRTRVLTGAPYPNPVEAFRIAAAAARGRWDNVDAERYVAHMRDKCDDACEFCAEEEATP